MEDSQLKQPLPPTITKSFGKNNDSLMAFQSSKIKMEKVEIEDNPYLKKILGVAQWLSNKLGSRERLALLLMSIANLTWPLSFLFVNQHSISPLHTSLARGIAIVLTHWPICRMLGIDLDFKSTFDLRQLFQRNTLMAVHQFYYFIMQFVVSQPIINTILLSGPLFVFIIDYFMNGVTITQRQLVSIAAGICGVAITVNADLILSMIDPTYKPESDFKNYIVDDPTMKIMLSGIAVLCNIGWAFSIVGQKKIAHVPGIKISYHLGLEFILLAGLLLCFKPAQAIEEQVFLGATICSGAIMGFCQILFMSALNLTKNTGVLTMLMLLYTVTAYFVSFFRYNEPINILAIMGLALMGCGLAATIFSKKT